MKNLIFIFIYLSSFPLFAKTVVDTSYYQDGLVMKKIITMQDVASISLKNSRAFDESQMKDLFDGKVVTLSSGFILKTVIPLGIQEQFSEYKVDEYGNVKIVNSFPKEIKRWKHLIFILICLVCLVIFSLRSSLSTRHLLLRYLFMGVAMSIGIISASFLGIIGSFIGMLLCFLSTAFPHERSKGMTILWAFLAGALFAGFCGVLAGYLYIHGMNPWITFELLIFFVGMCLFSLFCRYLFNREGKLKL